MTNIVANGNAYSDDGSSSRDMQGGGFRQWLLPMLGDVMQQTGDGSSAATDAADAAALSAATASSAAIAAQDALDAIALIGNGWTPVPRIAVDGARYVLEIYDWTGGLGPKPTTGFLAASGLVPTVAGGLNFRGAVAYADLTGKPTLGTAAALNVPAAPATAAAAGEVVRGDDPRLSGTLNVATLPREARTSNSMIVVGDQGKLIDFTTGGFTQTFAACATLANGFTVWLRNSSTTEVLLDPNGSETIDGYASFYMYPGEVRQVYCDGSVLRSLVITPFVVSKRTSFTLSSMPPGYSLYGYDLLGGSGGGGGGGSGARRLTTAGAASGSSGGGAGSAAGRQYGTLPARDFVGQSVGITVGAAGLGGDPGVTAAGTTNTNGAQGTAGTNGGATTLVLPISLTTYPASNGGLGGAFGRGGTYSGSGTVTGGAGSSGAAAPNIVPPSPAIIDALGVVAAGLAGNASATAPSSTAGDAVAGVGTVGGAAPTPDGLRPIPAGKGGDGAAATTGTGTSSSGTKGDDGQAGRGILWGIL